LKISELAAGVVYATRRMKYAEVRLAVMIACDRQYAIWRDSFEDNYRISTHEKGMLADSYGVAVVPLPQEDEENLLKWVGANHPPERFPAVERILTQYSQLGDSMRGMAKDIRLRQGVLADLIILPPGHVLWDLPSHVKQVGEQRLRAAHKKNVNHAAVAELRSRFNSAFAPLTLLGVHLDLILDSPHGAHSRLSIEDMETIADFIRKVTS
jgi:hypothetical protein